MGSFDPPDDAFDDADIENLEQASQAILTTLVAHSPAGAVAAHDALKLQVRTTVYANQSRDTAQPNISGTPA